MKIITWNVNGIRAVTKKGFKNFIKKENPDILCIQETKAFEEQFLNDLGNIDGYKYIWHSGEKAGYAGTAIFYKQELEIIDYNNNFEKIEKLPNEGRITEIKFDGFRLINGYFPNGGTRADGTEMLNYKLDFYDKIIDYSNNIIAGGENVIITGDFNICHEEIDIARPKENEKSIGFLPIERKKITEFLSHGYIDVFRYFYPDKKDIYSWWSYRAGARPKNIGWRLDYFIVNKNFINKIKDVKYLTNIEGSDHCPVVLVLNLKYE